MEENVTSNENIENNVEETTEVDVEPTGNLQDEKKELRYKSIEEAERAKNETDRELARFANFTKVLTTDDAIDKIEALYQVDPEEVNRFYKRIYGKSFDDSKTEKEQEEIDKSLQSENPEIYELKKELNELKKQLNINTNTSKEAVLKQYLVNHPEISNEDLSQALEYISDKLSLDKRLEAAHNLLKAEGKIKNENEVNAYKKQSASIAAIGGGSLALSSSKKLTQKQIEIAKKCGNDPTTVY